MLSRHKMVRICLAVGLVNILAGCTQVVSEHSIFRANEQNRRAASSEMTLDNEAMLPKHVELIHYRIPSAIGSIAITYADTGSERLIIHCGGNSSDRKSDGVNYLEGLIPFGNVMLFDYPGYGDSEGNADIPNFEAALDAIAKEATKRASSDVVVWGHSLGGFICGQLVKRLDDRLEYVVFETSATNAATVADAWVPVYLKPFVGVRIEPALAGYDNIEALRNYTGKILVIGAKKDKQLPVKLSRDLDAKLKANNRDVTYIEFPEAAHQNVRKQPEYLDRIYGFFPALK